MESLSISFKTHLSEDRPNIGDSYLYKDNLFIIVEGLGGGQLGETAKERASRIIYQSFFKHLSRVHSPSDALFIALKEANSDILQERRRIGQKMAASVSIVYIHGRIMYFTHLGDIRIYCLQKGELSQLTRDHTVREDNDFDETVSDDPRYLNALTEGLGFYDDPDIRIKKFALREKDQILMATEGLTKNVSDREILRLSLKSRNLKKLSADLIDAAHRGGSANDLTIGLIRFEGLAKDQQKKTVIYSVIGLLCIVFIGFFALYYESSEYRGIARMISPPEQPQKQKTAPVKQTPTPVKQAPAPVKQAPAPVKQAPAPVKQAPAPVVPGPKAKPPVKIKDPIEKPVVKAQDTSRDKILGFIEKWKDAWQGSAGPQGDMNRYLSFYSESFYARRLDKNGWTKDKTKKNGKKSWIKIKLTNIRISKPDDDSRVKVRFMQDYRSSNFSTRSMKRLTLIKEGNDWKIIKE